MTITLPKPVRESRVSVTLRRDDWDALVEMLEDIEDLAAVAAREARETAIGTDAAHRDYLTGEEMRRLLDWESPVKIWREKRGFTQRALAEAADISPSYLAEIETGRKPGSVDALLGLARALGVPMESLVGSNRVGFVIQHIKAIIEAGMPDAEALADVKRLFSDLEKAGAQGSYFQDLKDELRALRRGYGSPMAAEKDALLTAILTLCDR